MAMNSVQAAFNNGGGPGALAGLTGRLRRQWPVLGDAGRVPMRLYGLNLADGSLAWPPQERGDHYYIACVHKGVVVLVGRNSIDAIKLDDGSKAWDGRTITMPSGAGVCGHGFYAAGQYFVPLSSGEVVTIDVESGKTPHDRQAPPHAARSATWFARSRPGDFGQGSGRFGTLLSGRMFARDRSVAASWRATPTTWRASRCGAKCGLDEGQAGRGRGRFLAGL